MHWVSLQCVIVAFPDHNYLLFLYYIWQKRGWSVWPLSVLKRFSVLYFLVPIEYGVRVCPGFVIV